MMFLQLHQIENNWLYSVNIKEQSTDLLNNKNYLVCHPYHNKMHLNIY